METMFLMRPRPWEDILPGAADRTLTAQPVKHPGLEHLS